MLDSVPSRRPRQECRRLRLHDPIGIFRRKLIAKKTASAKKLDEIEAEVEAEVEKSVEFAEASPEPAPEALWEDVYVE